MVLGKKNLPKNLKGYMTVEAALIMPLALGVFLFLIFSAFFLYNKCVLTQDTYIKSHRASTFTYWAEGYGEVSYGALARRKPQEASKYIASRGDFSQYPFFTLDDERTDAFQMGVLTTEIYVKILVTGTAKSFIGRDYPVEITAVSLVSNPVGNIRSARRKYEEN